MKHDTMGNFLSKRYCPQITNFALNCQAYTFIFHFAAKLAPTAIFISPQGSATKMILFNI
jgi:hypothetical protein